MLQRRSCYYVSSEWQHYIPRYILCCLRGILQSTHPPTTSSPHMAEGLGRATWGLCYEQICLISFTGFEPKSFHCFNRRVLHLAVPSSWFLKNDIFPSDVWLDFAEILEWLLDAFHFVIILPYWHLDYFIPPLPIQSVCKEVPSDSWSPTGALRLISHRFSILHIITVVFKLWAAS